MPSFKLLNHNSILLNEKVYVDPFYIKEDSPKADYIFLTHPHWDHFSIVDIKKVFTPTTKFILPQDCLNDIMASGVERENITIVLPNNTYEIDNITIETFPAYNNQKMYHQKDKEWVSYLIKFDGVVFAILGDTDMNEENKNIKCDLLFVPIGGTYTMDYKEAAELTNLIKPRIVVPTHYDNQIVGRDPDVANNFTKLIDPDIKVNIFNQ